MAQDFLHGASEEISEVKRLHKFFNLLYEVDKRENPELYADNKQDHD